MKKFFWPIVSILLVAYPAIIYFGSGIFRPADFAIVLAVIVSFRFVVSSTETDARQLSLLLFVCVYVAVVFFLDSPLLLKLYPVLMSLAVSFIFLVSLYEPESLIEKIARMMGETITDNAKRYTRKLTAIWGGLLIVNAVVALYFALMPTMKYWALYCGFLSYLIFAAFFGLELLYRQYYKKKYGV